MIPTKQTVLHDPANGLHGNCLSAVLASLLHLPIDEVPLFVTPDTWVKDLNAWLRPFGLAYCMVEYFECHIDAYGIEGMWHEVSGNTIRSKDVMHACVAKDGEFVFDPHPDETGLTKINCHGFFIALEPWRALTHEAHHRDLIEALDDLERDEALLRQALEALESIRERRFKRFVYLDHHDIVIEALRERLKP